MIIGTISDSHRETKVAASAIEWLLARGADLLVHVGDIVESETLRLLRQSGKPYFAVLGNNDEALAELKNDFNLYDEPFCTEFAGLRLKIMHHPFYLFDEEPAAQNEADGLNLDADLGAGADCAANFRKDFGADLVKNLDFSDEVSRGTNLGSNCRADRGEILISNSKAAACLANLNSNFNATDDDEILNGTCRADENFDTAGTGANLTSNPNANLAVINMGSDMNSKASSGADHAVNLTTPSLNANLSAPNLSLNLTVSSSSDTARNSTPIRVASGTADQSLVLVASIASFVSLQNSVPQRNFALLQNSIPSQNFTSSRNSDLPQNSMPESYSSYAKKESQTPSFGYVEIYDRTSFFAAVADRYVTSMDYRRYGSDESKGLTDKRGISKNGTSANGRSVTADCHSTSAHQNSAMRNQNTSAMDWCDVSIDKNATVAYRQCAAVSYCHMAANQNTLATQNLNLRHARAKSGRDLRAQKAAFRFACIVVQEQKLRASSLRSQRKEL